MRPDGSSKPGGLPHLDERRDDERRVGYAATESIPSVDLDVDLSPIPDGVRVDRAAPTATSRPDRMHDAGPTGQNGEARRRREAKDQYIGRVLGSYKILSLIGEGGMGRVYRAEHTVIGRKVALKLLRPEYAAKGDAVHRFEQEARAVNAIGHENIVDITDFQELPSGERFFIMELLEGRDLADILRSGGPPIPLHRAMQIALQACDALHAAHEKEIIHRDLKPDNIFIVNTATRRDQVKLLDFGVAKLQGELAAESSWKTAVGSVIGTPAYMSPEQGSGIPVDSRTDIYSLGAILYEMFTGHPVFRAKSFGEYVVKHMNDAPVPPRDLADAPKIPAALERVILRCLEKDPSDRYGSVSELREDLARATATVETALHKMEGKGRRRRWSRRTLFAVPIGAGVVLLAFGAFWIASGLSVTDITAHRSAAEQSRSGSPPATTRGAGDVAGPRANVVVPPPRATQLPQGALLTLHSSPQGAKVYRKGKRESLGTTPTEVRLPLGEQIELVFKLSGHRQARERVKVTGDTVISVDMEPVARAATAAREPAEGTGRVVQRKRAVHHTRRQLTRSSRAQPDDEGGAGSGTTRRALRKKKRPSRVRRSTRSRGAKRRPTRSRPNKRHPRRIDPNEQVDPFGD